MKIKLEQGKSVTKLDVDRIATRLSLESFGDGHQHLLPLMRDALVRNFQAGAGVYLQSTHTEVLRYDPAFLIISLFDVGFCMKNL